MIYPWNPGHRSILTALFSGYPPLPPPPASCPLEGTIHHSVLRMLSPGAAEIRAAGLGWGQGESWALLASGQGCSQTAPHPILGSSWCLPELISEARKRSCAKPGCTVWFESLRCSPD